MKMGFLKVFIANINCNRSLGHRGLLALKRKRGKVPYTPWRRQEVVEEIARELSTPYEQVIPQSTVKRVAESDPTNHTLKDVAKFYTFPETEKQKYFLLGGFPKAFDELNTIFNESCLMIRKPALEIIEYMKNANYDKLPVKYVLYGDMGAGKKLTLLHVLHYAFKNNFVVFHLPRPHYMTRYGRREANFSETRPGLIDLPLEGVVFLKHFQLQNGALIDKLNLKTTKEYVWNARETTSKGESLNSLIKHGINRGKYSCDCIDALVDELKAAATRKEIKLFVVADAFNSLYSDKTMIVLQNKRATSSQVSIFQSFMSFLRPDWCNGAIALVVCESTTTPNNRGSSFPFFLLKRKGFEDLDPFIPVEVPRLTELEFNNLLDYYEDRRWLQKVGSRDELDFMTSRIAGALRDYCASL